MDECRAILINLHTVGKAVQINNQWGLSESTARELNLLTLEV